MYFENDEGVRTREAFALFSNAVVGHMFQTQGGDLSIPTLWMANNSRMWEVIGSILAYTIAVLYCCTFANCKFPLTCICQVTCWALLGLQGEEEEDALVGDLLPPLLSYHEEEPREFVASRRENPLAILRECNVSSSPATCQMHFLLVNVSRYSLLEAQKSTSGFSERSGRAFSVIPGAMIPAKVA